MLLSTAGDELHRKHLERRCILLVVGALCRQAKAQNVINLVFNTFLIQVDLFLPSWLNQLWKNNGRGAIGANW